MLKKNVIRILMICLCGLQLSCNENLLEGMASKTFDEAYLNEARKAMNNQDYQIAIEIILNQVSAEGQTKADTKELLAGAYAGKCGLNFLNFVDSLSHATSGTAFTYTATPFVGVVVDPPSCLSALSTMESIGPAASRTLSQNVFAAIAGMSLMGSATRSYTDNSPVNGDGSQDSAGISCGLTNTQTDFIILGFGYMSENFSFLTASQLGVSGAAFADVIFKCSSLGTSCSIKDPAAITPALRGAFRRLLNTKEYGVGTVVTGGDPTLIATACP